MPVTIRRIPTLATVYPVDVPATVSDINVNNTTLTLVSDKVPVLEEPIKTFKVPKGRSYLRNKRNNASSNRNFYNQPDINAYKGTKTLEQILPRVYNKATLKKENSKLPKLEKPGFEKPNFEDTNLDYYSPYRCTDCKDTKKIVVYDVCEFCDGNGCRECCNAGEIKNYIQCQSCKPKFR